MEKSTQENNDESNKTKNEVSIKDILLLNAFKGLTVPASYLKAIPKYFQKNLKQKNFPMGQSVVLKHDENEIHIRRKGYEDELIKDFDGLTTVTSIFSDSIEKFSHKHFLGSRIIHKKISSTTEDNKTIIKLELGEYQWESYGEIWSKIQACCAFIKSINLDSTQKIAIWADTCGDWLCACLALMYLKINVVTVYSTLVDDAIIYAINLTEVVGIFVDPKSSQRLFQLLDKLPTIKKIFLLGNYEDYNFDNLPTCIPKPIEFTLKKKFEQAPKLSRNTSHDQKISKTLKKSPMYFSLDEENLDVTKCDDEKVNGTNNKKLQKACSVSDIKKSLSSIVDCDVDTKKVDNTTNKNEITQNESIIDDGVINNDENIEKSLPISPNSDDKSQLENQNDITDIKNVSIEKQNCVDEDETHYTTQEKLNLTTHNDISDLTITQCHHINQFIVQGRRYLKNKELQFEKIDKEDIAVIMFTSGSSGMPKGVYIQHKNIAAAIGGGSYNREAWRDIIYPAYLPLAHIFEFVAEIIVAANGGAIGYCTPLTLTDSSPMVAPGSKGDFVALKPTIGSFVPLLLERIKKTVIEKVNQRGKLASSVLMYSVNHTKKMRNVSSDAPVVERLAFTRIRQLIGGHFRWALCGGAPLSPITQEFVNISFGFPIIQGYGLTETCGGGTFGNLDDFSIDNTGPPFAAAEIKLVPWAEGGYSPSDKPNPRGEILIGGECVALGYFRNDEATDEAFFTDRVTEQRWLRTGDIGEYCPNGTIKIIDRKKDIIKLKHGEYVSLIRIETAVLQCRLIELCCALPNKDNDIIVLLVMPNRVALRAELANLNPDLDPNSTIETIINDEKIKSNIENDIIKHGTENKLSKFEMPKRFVIVTDIWNPESGLLTPSMKVKRTEMKRFYDNFLN